MQALATLYLRAASIQMKDGRNIDHLLRYDSTPQCTLKIYPSNILSQCTPIPSSRPSLNTPSLFNSLSNYLISIPQYLISLPITLYHFLNIPIFQHCLSSQRRTCLCSYILRQRFIARYPHTRAGERTKKSECVCWRSSAVTCLLTTPSV